MSTRPQLDERVVRPSPEARTRLHAIGGANAPADSPELWLGAHLHALTDSVALERLAARAQRFTPRVSLVAPDGLLLEIKGSLHLFNGLEGSMRAFRQECVSMSLEPSIALAPTPLAAIVAARTGESFVVTNEAQLVGKLSAVPLAPLRWPEDVIERLARMGVRTIGQVLRLPRAGFARRFGPAQLGDLDQLLGRQADLRPRYRPRERFRRRRELTYELETSGLLLAVLAPLLRDLGQFLQARQCGITELECRLRHRQAPASRCVLRLASPVADVDRLTELLGERLQALVLPEPVRSCELRSGFPVPRVFASNPLWQPGEYAGGSGPEAPQLIERLRARLGHEAVHGLEMLPGHRPESTWSRTEPGLRGRLRLEKPAAPWPALRRPLWLLSMPQQLEEIDGMPRYGGLLRFCGDVERIETGWWDGGEIGRDYYTVFDIYNIELWVFRERAAPHRWFLHGVFG